MLLDALEDLSYSDELIGDDTAALVGTMQLRGVSVNFTDHLKFRLDAEDQRDDRVLQTATCDSGGDASHRGRPRPAQESKLRGRTISALVAPLAVMTRTGDGLGVKLVAQADAAAPARMMALYARSTRPVGPPQQTC